MTEIELLKKDIEKLKSRYDLEVANLKINYIASIIVVIAYLFFMQIGEIIVLGITISPMLSIIIVSIIIFLFFIKEAVLYAKFLSKKILKIKG